MYTQDVAWFHTTWVRVQAKYWRPKTVVHVIPTVQSKINNHLTDPCISFCQVDIQG